MACRTLRGSPDVPPVDPVENGQGPPPVLADWPGCPKPLDVSTPVSDVTKATSNTANRGEHLRLSKIVYFETSGF